MSPGTLESQGLINSAEYEKVTALTMSASPDAHKKIVDFFGRVKDKAGDMERILKEKDKHGNTLLYQWNYHFLIKITVIFVT
jgi:WD repeat-containing protein 7